VTVLALSSALLLVLGALCWWVLMGHGKA